VLFSPLLTISGITWAVREVGFSRCLGYPACC